MFTQHSRLRAIQCRKALAKSEGSGVVAECGTSKTLMAVSAIHAHSTGQPYAALVMAPPNIVGSV
jgi:hypothetical protein